MDGFKRVFGIGTYSAIRAPRSDLVTLTACGILPCANYKAQLEKRPERVRPPMWDMVFYVQDVCLKALLPFTVKAHLNVAVGEADTLLVYDATGQVRVPIVEEIEPVANAFGEPVQYRVHARLPRPRGGHQGCIVVPAEALVPAIYYPVFGPASKADCEAWVTQNCNPEDVLRAGEIPWPLAVQPE